MRALLPCLVFALFVVPTRAQRLLHELVSPNQQTVGYFGYAVAGVPDADGDGRGDLLVGAVFEGAGRAYAFSGATGALLFELQSPNEETDGYFGGFVAGVEDLDGDGRGDLLVGAIGESPGPSPDDAGRAYVFSGANGALLHELRSPNEERDGAFGGAVSGVPDVDGDGLGDLLVGAQGEGSGPSPGSAGRAYVFSGATGALRQELRSPNEERGGLFGWSASGVPDVDGDGRGDVVVGTPAEDPDPEMSPAGRAYVFGSATGTLLFELAAPDEEGGFGYFGDAVAGVADVDGDGWGDLLVGAAWENSDEGLVRAGRAYVFSGATGALLHELLSPNEELNGQFGQAVSGVPDVDGDGRGDLLVGADGEDPVGSPPFAGRAYVFSGASGALLATLASPNEEMGGTFGSSVAGVEDADGGGRGDLLVGAPLEDPGPSPELAGRAYLFSGDSTTVAVEPVDPAAFALEAPRPNPSSGRVVLAFSLVRPSPVRLAVYDGLGREVAVVVSGSRAAGRHEAVLEAGRLPVGVYLVRLEAGGHVETRRLTLVR